MDATAEAREVKIPAALLAIGVAIFVAFGFWEAGSRGAGAVLLALTLSMAIGVVLGILACFIAARILGISFGPLSTASLKLAAVFVFPTAIGLLIPIPFIGWFISLALYWGLLAWLFELEGIEVVVCVLAIFMVRFLAFYVVAVFLRP